MLYIALSLLAPYGPSEVIAQYTVSVFAPILLSPKTGQAVIYVPLGFPEASVVSNSRSDCLARPKYRRNLIVIFEITGRQDTGSGSGSRDA